MYALLSAMGMSRTLAELAECWRDNQSLLRTLDPTERAYVTAYKDRVKAILSSPDPDPDFVDNYTEDLVKWLGE